MIPFYRVAPETAFPESREQVLAREMGRPPWGASGIPSHLEARELLSLNRGALLGLIFDAEFWYSPKCWHLWVETLWREGAGGTINVPLGNQDASWRSGNNVPPYLTLRGLEAASEHAAPQRWMVKRGSKPEHYCVAVASRSILEGLPAGVSVGELPGFWAEKGQDLRIFCEGWLHSFNATKDAGSRRDLLSMCDWHGKVLELGCGTGLMAKVCKETGCDVSWVGLDLNGESLGHAKSSMNLAVRADLNQALPFVPTALFDRIVCGDVLEHLPYPWELLRRLRVLIKPDGLLLASVPNIGHWSVVEDLLCGRWDETPSGVFCVSHLRFGTKKSWERWFEKGGWRIKRWEEERLPLPEGWVAPSGRLKEIWDRRSLETVRYRLMAQKANSTPLRPRALDP
jgi:2-polyprenyl-3-methyl-5-hydroxy-6-metoxy-1,4-benzoquinol methylase